MLGIDQARVFQTNQFFHHCEKIHVAFIGKHFRVFLPRYLYTHVAEVHVIDAVSRSKIPTYFHGILAHLSRYAAIESNSVRRARNNFYKAFPTLSFASWAFASV